MKLSDSNTYLTISCSLSLLLIGFFMHIDQGKVDKKASKISNLFFASDQSSPEDTCNSSNVWLQGEHTTSSKLDNYISDKSLVTDSELHKDITLISECVDDKNLFIAALLDNSSNDTNHISSLTEIINKYFTIHAAFGEKKIQPRQILLSISLSENSEL